MYELLMATGFGIISSSLVLTSLKKIMSLQGNMIQTTTNTMSGVVLYGTAIGGFLTGYLLAFGTGYELATALIFTVIAIIIVEGGKRITEAKRLEKKKQECMILFETIEFFLRAGIPLQKSLAESQHLVTYLKPAINKSLIYWPSGSIQALEVLRQEICLPEGDILISLLIQLNQSGAENFNGIIQREAHRLEEMRIANEKTQISRKPLFLIAYRLLPLLVVMGLIAGSLITKMFAQITSFM